MLFATQRQLGLPLSVLAGLSDVDPLGDYAICQSSDTRLGLRRAFLTPRVLRGGIHPVGNRSIRRGSRLGRLRRSRISRRLNSSTLIEH